MKKLSIAGVTSFFLLLPVALAAQHSVQSDMISFVDAFKYLFKGSSAGFASGIVGSLPLLAVVLIVFGLSFFLGKLTIFKDDAHTKYARMVAVGIALLGLATPSLYNSILSWSGAFLNISFILAIIFMFIMFLNNLRKNNSEVLTEMRTAQKQSLSAKKDIKQMKHEFELDEKQRDRVKRDLGTLADKLDSMKKLPGSELQMIDKLADLLRRATSAMNQNDQSSAHGYAQMLAREIGTLITTMKHEDTDESALDKILMEIDHSLDRWGHDDDLEKNEEKHLNVIFSKVSNRVASAGADVAQRMVKELLQDDTKNLLHLLREVRSKVLQLAQLKDMVMKSAEELRSSGYRAKHLEAQAVRTAIFSMQLTEAHNHLDQLRSLVEHEPTVIAKVQSFESQMTILLSQLTALQQQLDVLLVGELSRIQKLVKDEKIETKQKEKEYETMADDIFGNAHRLARSVDKLKQSLHYIATERVTIPGPQGGEAAHQRDEITSAIGLLEGEHAHLMEIARKEGQTDLNLKKELVHFKEYLSRLRVIADSIIEMLQKFGGAPNAVTAAEQLNVEIKRLIRLLNAEDAKIVNSGNAITLR